MRCMFILSLASEKTWLTCQRPVREGFSMIRECFFAFTLIVLLNSWMLRSGIVDAYQFKRTNREKKNYNTTHSLRFRILLPYREMKNCSAPRHMRFFQIMRRVNIAVIAFAGMTCIFSEHSYTLRVIGYVIMGSYCLLYLLPLDVYAGYLKGDPKNLKGWNFNKSRRP